MNHLTDQQLTELLYQECDESAAKAARQHIDDCHHCEHRFHELSNAIASLDEFGLPEPDTHVEFKSPAATLIADQTAPVPSRWRSYMMAVSILALVASCGFLAGSWYQSMSIDSRLTQADMVPRSEMESLVLQLVENRIPPTGKASEAFESLGFQLKQLADQQHRFRQDLQTLAVNAESQINLNIKDIGLTKRDLARLNEILTTDSY